MRITLIQSNIRWENIQWNQDHLSVLIREFATDSDLVLLPEMFTTGFTMKSQDFAEEMNGSTHLWMRDIANKMNIAISGSLIIKDNSKIYNRLLFVEPGNISNYYDKRHLFGIGGEDKNFDSGNKQVLIEYRNTKISPLICYDLRFPVWSRNTKNYDLLCYHANWPASRDDVWQTLLKARALENQCYVAGINRVGIDEEGIEYIGNSQLIDPKGNIIMSLGNEENIETTTIDLDMLSDFRRKFPVWKDRDEFRIQ